MRQTQSNAVKTALKNSFLCILIGLVCLLVFASPTTTAWADLKIGDSYIVGDLIDESEPNPASDPKTPEQWVKYDGKRIWSDYPSQSGNIITIDGVSWDNSTKTLTFKNVNLKPESYFNISINGSKLNIKFSGSNNFNDQAENTTQLIKADKYNVTVTGGNATFNHCGLVEAKTVNIKSGNYVADKLANSFVHATGKITINKSAKINIRSKTSDLGTRSFVGSSMSNQASSFKSLYGELPKNGQFAVAGNIFKQTDTHTVTLLKYGKSSKTFKINTVKNHGSTYQIKAIAANAFNTKWGKRVRSLTIGKNVRSIGKYAFKNTKSLTSLKVPKNSLNLYKLTRTKSANTDKLSTFGYYFKFKSGVSKYAFKNMGKSNGKKLKVHVGYKSKSKNKLIKSTTNRNTFKHFKSAMKKKGMNSRPTVLA